jgi:5-methyltetrahydrofolate--homocysteine methyltransferase
MDYGIPKEDVIIDPLVMPIGAKRFAGRAVFQIIRRVREELGCNTVCGSSNVSFGLPNRKGINATFIPMLMAAGMTSAITNPLESEIKQAIMAADALMGNDENCASWIQANAEGESAAKRQDRQAARRRRQISS